MKADSLARAKLAFINTTDLLNDIKAARDKTARGNGDLDNAEVIQALLLQLVDTGNALHELIGIIEKEG